MNPVHKFGLANQKTATDLLREQPVNNLRTQELLTGTKIKAGLGSLDASPHAI
jgi:hypothetical protein